MFCILLHRSRRVEDNFIIPRDFDTSIAGECMGYFDTSILIRQPATHHRCWLTSTVAGLTTSLTTI